MNIAFFTDTYYPQINGVTISVENFARELRKKGHSVYIFAPKIEDYEDTDPFVIRLSSVKILPSSPEVLFPFFLPHKIISQILPLKFDIVHAHGNGAFSFLGYQIARMKDVPYVLTFHTQFTKYTHYIFHGKVVKPRMVATGLRLFGNICDGIITPSEKMKNELEKYGIKKPISIIPNFVTLSKFHKKKGGFLHKQCEIPSDAKILLSVGRLGKEKNFPFIINAFKKLTEKDKTTHLVIVGYGVEQENLIALIHRLELEERVHLTGKISNEMMPQVYSDTDIFVFASTTEVHPMVVLEAAAAGLPLVVVNDKAFHHIVENNVNGFTLPLKQNEFVEKIAYLLADAGKRQSFSKESLRVVKDYFNEEKILSELLIFYEQTMLNYKKRVGMITQVNRTALVKFQQTAELLEKFFSL